MTLFLHVSAKDVNILGIYHTFLTPLNVTILEAAKFDGHALSTWLPWLHDQESTCMCCQNRSMYPLSLVGGSLEGCAFNLNVF